ncbi:hypothetical protein LTR78_004758 [Recurvomyces mirabilis]|uniref:Uncharacterized protein n=1 Tax=Recurvomyces mirabilis TaxID=574656 RepID=A0AAE0WP36_9PEZI|nr:hypothetical protein LTR78_004758 [Recurvomyces mirabilis]KAK5157929.1 hypothetical protein LTS14_003852 [Recurvomyces mirabilis]
MISPQVPNPKGLTTLTGRPLEYNHDTLTNVMLGDGGAGFTSIGANMLPQGYTDDSVVQIPIKLSDYETPKENLVAPEEKRGFLRRLSNSVQIKQSNNEEFKMAKMRRGDYLKYWAKGEDGNFLPAVKEPKEGRKAWVEKQLELYGEVKRV